MGEKGLRYCALLSLALLCGCATTGTTQIANNQCSVKPYKYLVGHTLADVMATKLPPETHIYRYDDPDAQFEKIGKNRLNIEIGENTIVTKLYCS